MNAETSRRVRSARWIALGYFAGSAAAMLAARSPQHPKLRVEAIRIKRVRRGLVRFKDTPEWVWLAEVDLECAAARDYVKNLLIFGRQRLS